MRNKIAHAWSLEHMRAWVEPYLIAHGNTRVRQAAALLRIALVPSSYFRQVRARVCDYDVPFANIASVYLNPIHNTRLFALLLAIYLYVITFLAHLQHHDYVSSHDVSRVI